MRILFHRCGLYEKTTEIGFFTKFSRLMAKKYTIDVAFISYICTLNTHLLHKKKRGITTLFIAIRVTKYCLNRLT